MKPIIFTREGLYPLWSDLSERTARARHEFKSGEIDEGAFRRRLEYLGFSWGEIQVEVAQNKPTMRQLNAITSPITERLRK